MMDLSQDNCFDYGLPGEGLFSRTNETDLKIVAVEGNYSHKGESNERKHKQEQDEWTEFTSDELREKTFTQMEVPQRLGVF